MKTLDSPAVLSGCLTRAEQTDYLRAAKDMETGLHGGFCAGLAAAYFAASPANRLRLLVAFPAEFEHAINSLDPKP